MKKNQTRLAGVCLLSLGMLLSTGCNDQSVEYEKMITACEKVQIGDSEQAVKEMMGEPMNVVNRGAFSGNRKILTYPTPAIVPSGPHIYIDASGHVDEITCYESHRLKKDQSNSPESGPPSIR